MKKILISIVITVFTTASYAGYKYTHEVMIYDTGVRVNVTGALGSVRNSSDSTQNLYCFVNDTLGYCLAEDSAGNTAECSTTDPGHIRQLQGMNGDSYIYFSYPTGSPYCDNINLLKGSMFEPKQP